MPAPLQTVPPATPRRHRRLAATLALAAGAILTVGQSPRAGASVVRAADLPPLPNPVVAPAPAPPPVVPPAPVTPVPVAPPAPVAPPTPVAPPAPVPHLTWSVAEGSRARAGSVVTVVVRAPAAGSAVSGLVVTDSAGRVVPTRRVTVGRWTSAPLPPSRSWVATATVAAPLGTSATAVRRFSTRAPAHVIATSLSPGTGSTVGIAQPVIVTFDRAVTQRAEVEAALRVTTSRPVGPAAWHWFGDRRVEYRPRSYWPGRTRITVRLALKDVAADSTTWGTGNRTLSFSTGRAQILRIDDRRHTMRVVRGSQVVRTMGVSLGKPGYTTRSGIKAVMSRETSRRMRSSTVGIEGAEAYDLVVPYALRITTSGEFIHGAPWNPYIGRLDHSHGCTNLRLADSRWLYANVLVGDPVETVGTGRGMETDNGPGAGWNIRWAAWVQGSATGVRPSTVG